VQASATRSECRYITVSKRSTIVANSSGASAAGSGASPWRTCSAWKGARDAALKPNPRLNGGVHHRAKVKRVVQLFMNGGASQMELFDYKHALIQRHGQKFDPGGHVEASQSQPCNIMRSPFEFKQHGQSGRWVSSALPH
jgi:hypothetical protein